MTLNASQQQFLDDLAINYARFVTAFTDACEADNAPSVTTLDDCPSLRAELQLAAKLIYNSIQGGPGYFFCLLDANGDVVSNVVRRTHPTPDEGVVAGDDPNGVPRI